MNPVRGGMFIDAGITTNQSSVGAACVFPDFILNPGIFPDMSLLRSLMDILANNAINMTLLAELTRLSLPQFWVESSGISPIIHLD